MEKNQATKKITRKNAVLIAALAIAAVAIVLLITQVLIPRNEYLLAEDMVAAGQHGKAVTAFRELGDYSDSAARAEALMDAIQIRHLENKRADKLSGGETARMALVRLMMGTYGLVILDEPTAAMDMETTLLSENLIGEYVRETGCSLILVTHSLQQARRLADEVWYFHKGKLLESGSGEAVLDHPKQPETRQFLDFYGI